MAAIYTPARHPFGVVTESKLRSLQSIKNRQNALAPSSTPNLKRRAPSPELSDSENVDPNLFDYKRKRTSFDDDVSLTKNLCSNSYITPMNTSTKISKTHSSSSVAVQASRLHSLPRQTPKSTPLSVPAATNFAAGRSPPQVNARLDRQISQPRRRFVPPSLSQSSPSISINSALKGTLAHKKSVTRQNRKQTRLLEDSKPKSWYFDIFEESEETQDYRMCEWTMTQSSAALDISDDESKCKSSVGYTDQADKGKENIDPNEVSTVSMPVTRAAAAAAARIAETVNEKDHMKIEEQRSPLVDLKTADYYGEGLDATSVVLVHDEEPTVDGDTQEESPVSDQAESIQLPSEGSFTFTSPVGAVADITEESISTEEVPEWAQRTTSSLDTGHDATATKVGHETVDSFMPTTLDFDADCGDIEIWESESAKDENENGQEETSSNTFVVWEGEKVSVSAFSLQEL